MNQSNNVPVDVMNSLKLFNDYKERQILVNNQKDSPVSQTKHVDNETIMRAMNSQQALRPD